MGTIFAKKKVKKLNQGAFHYLFVFLNFAQVVIWSCTSLLLAAILSVSVRLEI